MNEEELFSAYRVLKMEYATGTIEQIQPLPGTHRCVVDQCPTLIADWSPRVMCWFHEGKRRRGEPVL